MRERSYVDWIIRNKLFDKEDVTELLNKFEKYKNKIDIQYRDINKLTYDQLKKIIEELDNKGNDVISKSERLKLNKKKAEEESDVVFNDDQYIVVVPKSKFASRYFGAGSDWCTARQDDESCMFDDYNENGELFIVKDKHTKEKFQLYKGDNVEYKDSDNEHFNPFERFEDDEELIDWLNEEEFVDIQNDGLTDEQLNELGNEIVSQIGFKNQVIYNDALDLVKNIIMKEADSIGEFLYDMQGEAFNLYRETKDAKIVEKLIKFYKEIEEYLKYFGVYINNDKNKLKIVSKYLDYFYLQFSFGDERYDNLRRTIKSEIDSFK